MLVFFACVFVCAHVCVVITAFNTRQIGSETAHSGKCHSQSEKIVEMSRPIRSDASLRGAVWISISESMPFHKHNKWHTLTAVTDGICWLTFIHKKGRFFEVLVGGEGGGELKLALCMHVCAL